MPTPILTTADHQRDQIRRKAVEGLQVAFPMTLRDHKLELQDVKVHTKDFGPDDQKRAIMEGTTLHEAVKGTVVLKNSEGKVVEQVKNFTLMQLPYFTERHSFIVGGNEYQVANQIRMKPGVYTRKRANEEIETAFNLAKGSNFRMSLDPEKGVPFLKYESTTIPLYPALRGLGVPHTDIAKAWGSELAAANQAQFAKKEEATVEKLYKKIYRPQDQTHATHEARVQAIHDAYSKTVMDPQVNAVTLGSPHAKVTLPSLLDASKKLLHVYRSDQEVDDRDSLAFKTFHSVADFVKERLQLDARAVASKVRLRATNKTGVRDILPTAPFSNGIKSFLTGSQLSSIPTAINPVELIDHALKVTSMGEGGISSERAIPNEARYVHATHLGILDPVRTPESFSAGVDIRASLLAHRDEHGNLYTPVRNLKTQKMELLSAGQLEKETVAFPNQPKSGEVEAMYRGSVTHVPRAQCTYEFHTTAQFYSPTANLLPLLESMQGNRATMASKHQTQALPLLQREVPLVQSGAQFLGTDHKSQTLKSFEHALGHMIVPVSQVSGTVAKVDHQFIYIKPDRSKKADEDIFVKEADDDLVKVPYSQHFPFASKTSLHHTLNVKAGDRVHEGQALGDSNYTRDGTLALGKNLRVGYMAYYGLNSNDAVVISSGAAEKLTSEHMYRESFDLDTSTTLGKEVHRNYFGSKYTAAQYDKLDAKGVVKKGAKLMPHDPFVVGVRKAPPTPTDQLLGNIKRSLALPVREEVHLWGHDFEGEVMDVFQSERRVVVTIRTRETMRVGDKLTGRHGNKGVVSRIVPDDQMVQDAKGRPIDVLYTSQGIISRINPSQVLETSLGKVAEKTGKPIVLESFTGRDNVQFAKDLLKKHGISDKETVYDPVSGKKIPGVLVGPQYTLRLFKTTDTNFSARGTGSYDANQQPIKGGELGAKGVGMLEFNGLLAHNARAVLKETATIKSQKNEDFWRALQLGLPLPKVHSPFAYEKFIGMMQAAGIAVNKNGGHLTLKPMTDAETMKLSAGAIQNEKLVRAKDLMPERGGLFDPSITGGDKGTRWSHIELAEPIVNPVFTEPARRLLGVTGKVFDALHKEKGGAALKATLNKIDLAAREKELQEGLKKMKGADLDDAVRQIKYVKALRAQGLKAGDAYVISKLPVLPPIMRPIMPTNQGGNLVVGDANELYRNAILHNDLLHRQNKDGLLPPEEHQKLRTNLISAVGAVVGTNDTDNPKMLKRNVKGFLEHLTGKTTPKSSFFQKKVMKRQQDASGRGTIAPDGALGMDQVGLPEDMLWEMFSKFTIARLVRQGFPALKAKEMVEEHHPAARDAMLAETRERPVMVNRAPSLHRYNVVGAYAVPTPGKTITVNPFIEKGMAADYDGDEQNGIVVFCLKDRAFQEIVDTPMASDKTAPQEVSDTMAAHFRELVGYVGSGTFYMCNLEDFPHVAGGRRVNDHTEVFGVPPSIEVVALNPETRRLELMPVSTWSKHTGQVTEIVTLGSGRQIVTDDDPRAVLGVDKSLRLTHARPKDSVGLFVPRARWLPDIATGEVKAATGGGRRLLADVQLNTEVGRAIGTLVGDGWVARSNGATSNQVTLAALDASVSSGYAKDLEHLFRDSPDMGCVERVGGDFGPAVVSRRWVVSSREFADWVSPLIGHTAGRKHLPPFFLVAPRDFRLGLLAGIIDTDGSIAQTTSKKKPQWLCIISTKSLRLAQEIVLLCKSLSVTATIGATQTPRGERHWQISLSIVDLHALQQMPCNHADKLARFQRFFSETAPSKTTGAYGANDPIPTPEAVSAKLRKLYPNASSRYSMLCKHRKGGSVPRPSCETIIAERPEVRNDPELADWIALVENTAVQWDRVVAYENTGIVETGYDLTVPGSETFMAVDGTILSNTFQVHAPVTHAAIEDVKRMTLSNLVFGDRAKDDLMVHPAMEAVLGISLAAKDKKPDGKTHKFKTKADAVAAYRRGELSLQDQVVIG